MENIDFLKILTNFVHNIVQEEKITPNDQELGKKLRVKIREINKNVNNKKNDKIIQN